MILLNRRFRRESNNSIFKIFKILFFVLNVSLSCCNVEHRDIHDVGLISVYSLLLVKVYNGSNELRFKISNTIVSNKSCELTFN